MKRQALNRKRFNKAKARIKNGHIKAGDLELVMEVSKYLDKRYNKATND